MYHLVQYFLPLVSNHSSSSFTILAQNPDSKIPKVYDPPQRYGKGSKMVSMPLIGEQYETNMDYYFVDKTLTPEEIATCRKPNAAKISEDLFEKLLRPHPDSSIVPEPFRNHLLWMEDNHMAEELVSFNNWAWRSQTEGNGRAIGLGNLKYEWTNDASQLGRRYSFVMDMNLSVQESPCKKYLKLASLIGGKAASWLTMYIIQEGDVFVDRNGKPMPDVNPGDILRITYGDASDPYECSPDEITFKYFAHRVATYNEETGKVERNSPHYNRIMDKVNAPLPLGIHNVAHFTHPERFDLSRVTVCDLQLYTNAPVPPTGAEIEDL
jgi:hypothetical protein